MSQTTHYYPVRESHAQVVAEQEAGTSSSYSRKVLYLIGFFSLLRLLVAFTLELGNDESYYWLYGQELQWNYFDHPPMVALWVRLFTANLLLQDWEGFVRLGSVVGCALSTWFIYKASSVLHSERVGWLAACLYNTSFYAGVITGILIWPDAPQMVFWTFSLWMLARILQNEKDWANWLLFGLASGLCIMSKVHGVFLWVGLGLYILLKQRAWLLRPQVYAAILLALMVATPILVWNLQHDFATYRFHSGRVKVEELSINSVSFGEEVLGQLLFNNPFNVFLVVAGLLAWRKNSRIKALQVYNLVALSLIGLLLAISLFRDTILPHWSGPAYVTLLPLAAVQLNSMDSRRLFPNMLRWCLGACGLFFISWNALVHFYPGTLGVRSGTELGYGDPSLDLYGWEEAGKSFTAFHQAEVQKGTMPPDASVVARKWWGAHVEYYFCRPAGLTMIGLGWEHLHHYLWLNRQRKESANLSAAYCIVPSDEYYDVQQAYSIYYDSIELVHTIKTYRSSRPAHNFYIYRLSGWKGTVRYMEPVHRP
jgi:4-amino-4-deoxy-L-arabinose transferase-like glycosyltransferase